MNSAAGITLGNRYALTERIAAGGMGEVWEATDTVLGRTVAVKLLHPGLSQENDFVERFRAEARHTAGFQHPNITTVFDYGEEDGTAYLVLELVVGQPLSQIIYERAPLSAQETTSILIQAATALAVAHRGGVVHRDVKPANILVTADGTAKLTDFGISRLTDAAPLTQTGSIIGTAQYLSPEQAMGQSATASSDIYALGIVGHEMLTGKRPFDAGTMVATALAHINQEPPPLPDTLPVGIRGVIAAALSKDPANRPTSAAAMAHALGMPDAPAALAPAALAPAPTLTMSAAAMPAAMMAQAQPTLAMPTVAPGMRKRPTGHQAAWLLGAGAVLGILTFFLLSGINAGTDADAGTKTPATPSTTAPSNPNNRTPKIATIPKSRATPNSRAPAATRPPAPAATRPPAPAVTRPPVVAAPLPRQDNRGKGSGKDQTEENRDKDENRGGRG